MNISEIKKWSKEKVKGKRWSILAAIIVTSLLTSLSFGARTSDDSFIYINIGWVFYVVEVGLAYYMVNFITDKKYSIDDLFHFSKDFIKALLVNLLSALFVFLWSLLFIIPGIIKSLSYSLIPMIMSDEKYKDLGYMDILKLSQDMMKGHKWEFFVLGLSFMGWHILSIFTLFILELWISPYQQVAITKFLYEIKKDYENNNKLQ